jgi:hypothetical protein
MLPVADMILTTTEGPLSALLLLFFLVSRAMCTEPAAQPRVRVRALEYRGPDNTAGDPSVSVALLVELRKEPGSMLRSLELAVGSRDAPSLCQPAVLTGVTTVNSSSLWSADQEDQLRVVNFPLVMSSLNVSSLKTGDGGDEKRTLPLCVSVNGEAWTQAGWIFFPPFQEVVSSDSDSKDVASDSKDVGSDSKHLVSDSKLVVSDSKHMVSSKRLLSDSKDVVSDSKHLVSDRKHVASDSKRLLSDSKNVATGSKQVASDSKHVASDSKDVASDSKHLVSDRKQAASDSKHLASDSKLVASDSKHAASDSKDVASDSEHSDRESDGVSNSPEVSETETAMTGMA